SASSLLGNSDSLLEGALAVSLRVYSIGRGSPDCTLTKRRIEGATVIDGQNLALAVDDEPEDLKILCNGLAHLGYDVISAGDGERASREFSGERRSIDL